MSTQYDRLRLLAVDTATTELGRRVREIGMENRGPVIDVYLTAGNVGRSTMNDTTASGEQSRMWCGYFVNYCYIQAARQLSLTLPFRSDDLAGGRKLRIWSAAHPESRITDGIVQAGDIFAIQNDHVGMAIGPAVNGIFPTIEGNEGDLSSNWNGIARKTKNISACRVIVRI